MKGEYKTKDLADRWISLLRHKASSYEHEARKRGETVTSPSIDNICNEMTAYFTGIIANEKQKPPTSERLCRP